MFAKDASDVSFSLCCGSEPRDFLWLTWLEFEEEDKAFLTSKGFEIVPSFTANHPKTKKYLCSKRVNLAQALSILSDEGANFELESVMPRNLACCGNLVLKSTSDDSVVKIVPICFGLGGEAGWYCTENSEVVYVASNHSNAYTSVSTAPVANLPLYAAFVCAFCEQQPDDLAPSGKNPDDLDSSAELVNKINDLTRILTGGLNDLADKMNKLPDTDQTHKILDVYFDAQGKKLLSLATDDQLGRLADVITETNSETKEQISGLESHLISPDAIRSINDLLNTVLTSLSELRSYDDELRNLVSGMSSSLATTYNDVLAKAKDVALKDVSLSNSVSSLSDALEKLGSLRSLAEKSDSALDSLVTLLPTLSNIESHIVSGAQRLSDDCARLSEASGKVEACAEQALSSTVSSNNTLSAIKDCSAKRDIALVTMTALTAAASVASSVASIKQSKRGPRC